jgi:serine/threonine-protein kinase
MTLRVSAHDLDEASIAMGDTPVVEGEVVAGKYRVERVIGSGGMGVVVAARHLDLGRLVALKFLRGGAGAEAAERFLREARATAMIHGEHVAHVIDLGRLPSGAPFIVFEHLEGRDLKQAIESDGAFPVARAVDVVLEACEAVAEAHAHGIVHRDLKPANLFLARRGSGPPHVKVLDFGIAKAFPGTGEGTLTSSSDLLGSSRYMSPEQLRSSREVTGRADLWGLGVVLVELLTGRTPFERGSPVETGWAILNEPADLQPALDAGVPPALVKVIERCLAKDPDQRTASVAELARALAPFGSHRAVVSLERTLGWGRCDDTHPGGHAGDASVKDEATMGARSAPEHERARGSRRRRGLVALATAMGLVIVGVGVRSRVRGETPAPTVGGAPTGLAAVVRADHAEALAGEAKDDTATGRHERTVPVALATVVPGSMPPPVTRGDAPKPPSPRLEQQERRAPPAPVTMGETPKPPAPSVTMGETAKPRAPSVTMGETPKPAAPPVDPLCPDGHCSRH